MNQPRQTSVTADPGEGTRTALIAAGRSLFASRGFDGASVRAITERAGTNLGSVTYHFGSKRGLYTAVLEDGLEPLARRVTAASSSGGSALDRMTAIVSAYFAHLREHPDLPHLLLQEIAAGKDPPALVVRTLERVMGVLRSLHAEGVEEGSIRAGHPLLTGLSIIAQPVYLSLISPMLQRVAGLDLSDDDTRDLVVAHATDFVRNGLRPTAPHPTQAREGA